MPITRIPGIHTAHQGGSMPALTIHGRHNKRGGCASEWWNDPLRILHHDEVILQSQISLLLDLPKGLMDRPFDLSKAHLSKPGITRTYGSVYCRVSA